jgi:hypothetical protein
MRSNAKSNTKKKPSKAAAAAQAVSNSVSESDQKKQIVPSERAKLISAVKNKPHANLSMGVIAPECDMQDETDAESCNGLYTLRYDINDRGIGKILLPPSLSTLLQSDRVAISPAAGGLFIRSL